jgi:dynamin 1-like protein
MVELQKGLPQQKPVNLLSEMSMQTSRKLSEREERDCDVIGKSEHIMLSPAFYIL